MQPGKPGWAILFLKTRPLVCSAMAVSIPLMRYRLLEDSRE
jgi:hypothetical protein